MREGGEEEDQKKRKQTLEIKGRARVKNNQHTRRRHRELSALSALKN